MVVSRRSDGSGIRPVPWKSTIDYRLRTLTWSPSGVEPRLGVSRIGPIGGSLHAESDGLDTNHPSVKSRLQACPVLAGAGCAQEEWS